jgi:hypothetical protein
MVDIAKLNNFPKRHMYAHNGDYLNISIYKDELFISVYRFNTKSDGYKFILESGGTAYINDPIYFQIYNNIETIIINDIIIYIHNNFLKYLQEHYPLVLTNAYWKNIMSKEQYISSYEMSQFKLLNNKVQIIENKKFWENKIIDMLCCFSNKNFKLDQKNMTKKDNLDYKRICAVKLFNNNKITQKQFEDMIYRYEKQYCKLKRQEYDHIIYFLKKDYLDFYTQEQELRQAQMEWEEDNRQYEKFKRSRE